MSLPAERIIINVRINRKKKNKSQQQVAKKINISQNAYSKIELGKTKLNLMQLIMIAEYLEIEVAELLK